MVLNNYSKKLFQNIPSDWELKQINHISKKRIEKNGIESNIYVGIENLETGVGRISGYEDQSNFSTKQIFHKNDLLYARIRPYLNKIWLSNVDGYCSTDIIVIKTSGINPNFLKEVILTREFVNFAVRHSAGTKMPRVNWGDIKKLHVPVPPLVEQRGIVEVLGTVDECIRLTDAVIERAEELKRGLMQRLLTRGIGHTEYKETPLGEIPKPWNLEKLQNLTNKITDGTHFTPNYIQQGIPFLRVTDIKDETISWDNVKKIAKEEHIDLLKRANPEKGDILLSKNGTVGITKVIDWDEEFSIFVSLCLIKPKHEIINNRP